MASPDPRGYHGWGSDPSPVQAVDAIHPDIETSGPHFDEEGKWCNCVSYQ
jgi:hypothetical protein